MMSRPESRSVARAGDLSRPSEGQGRRRMVVSQQQTEGSDRGEPQQVSQGQTRNRGQVGSGSDCIQQLMDAARCHSLGR